MGSASVLWPSPSFLGLFLCFSLFPASIPLSLHQVSMGQAKGQFTPCKAHRKHKTQQHNHFHLSLAHWKCQHPAGALVCSSSPCFCSLLPDLSSLTIPCEDEDDTYNDVDSSDSVNTTSHNTTLNQEESNVEMEEDIYEVLPGKQPKPEPCPSRSLANVAGDLGHITRKKEWTSRALQTHNSKVWPHFFVQTG